MRRREFIALMGASVAWPFAAMAQEPGRTYRLGGVSSSPRNAPLFVAMFDELRRVARHVDAGAPSCRPHPLLESGDERTGR
jgi:hypothetical protein